MSQTEYYRYGDTATYTAVELPYDGDELSMVVIMPKLGSFRSFEQALDPALVSTVRDGLRNAYLELTLPRFQVAFE